jgi:hypothetical protein
MVKAQSHCQNTCSNTDKGKCRLLAYQKKMGEKANLLFCKSKNDLGFRKSALV